MEQLFDVDETGEFNLNKEWIRLNPKMRIILERDKGSAGDVAGKFKKKAKREFNYIRMMWNPNSEYEHVPIAERRKHVLEVLEIHPIAYANDDALKEAEEEYKYILKSIRSYRAYSAAYQSLDSKIESLEKYNPDAVDKQGKLLMTPEQHSKALRAYKDDLITLDEYKNLLDKDIKQEIATKSTLKKGLREDRSINATPVNPFL